MIASKIQYKTLELAKDSALYNVLSSLGSCQNLGDWPENNYYYDNLPITKKDIPELIYLACSLELFSSNLEQWWIPVHAWRILGNLAATEASKPLIDCFDKYHECDFAFEELPLVLSKIGSAALGDLKTHLFNPSHSLNSKIIANDAIGKIALNHNDYYEECIDILANFLDQSHTYKIDKDLKRLNGMIIGTLQDLKAVSKIDSVRNAFAQNIVDLIVVGDIEDVEIELNLRKERETTRKSFFPLFELAEASLSEASNCPCGSGKKYKKCCIDLFFRA